MEVRLVGMLTGCLLVGLAVGCQEKTVEPVEQAPQVQQETLPVFPESLVPKPEPQPETAIASPLSTHATEVPVDTAATRVKHPPTVSPQPREHYAPVEKKTTRTYVVRKGDTLQKISMRYYGTTKKWRTLFKVNRNVLPKGPDKLQVGTKLVIP